MQKSVYLRHIKNQKTHWWFHGRRNLIFSLIKRFVYKKKKLRILDFGCGSGTNIKALLNFGEVHAYEKDKNTNQYLLSKYKNIKKVKILKKIKQNYLYDCIVLADVLEHIKDDKKILITLRKKLKKKGIILLTVPAYNFLFSKKDEVLKHFRRYEYSIFKKLLMKNFKVLKISFFNTILFLPIAIITIFFKFLKFDYINEVEETPNFFINKILYLILRVETLLLKYIDFPFGMSIILVGEKKNL